jgi:23S rRNA pseudouridine1911/1915/1917 synthase
MTPLILHLTEEQLGQRYDKALASLLPPQDCSRAQLQRLMRTGCIRDAQGAILDNPAHRIRTLGEITIVMPEAAPAQPLAQTLPLSIIYEDDDLLVLDKPPQLVVHPAAGHHDHTLVNALLAHCGDSLSGIGGVARPGIVHRLDKDTSGLMVVAKHDHAHRGLATQFSDRSLSRTYQALVWGLPKARMGVIDQALGRDLRQRQKMSIRRQGGKTAVTQYRLLQSFGLKASLLQCALTTGRTHQIRVHLAHIGHGVIGDPLYGNPRRGDDPLTRLLVRAPRQMLHAAALRLLHPRDGREMSFTTALPPDFFMLLRELRGYAKLST